MSLTLDCVTLPAHVQRACNNFRKGGLSAVAFIKEGTSIASYTSLANWEAAIAAGNVCIIKQVKAMMPAPAPVKGDSVTGCGPSTIVDGHDYVLNIKDYNVDDSNDELIAKLNLGRYIVAYYFCEEKEIRVTQVFASVTAAGPEVPESNREKQKYNITAEWFNVAGGYDTLYSASTLLTLFE